MRPNSTKIVQTQVELQWSTTRILPIYSHRCLHPTYEKIYFWYNNTTWVEFWGLWDSSLLIIHREFYLVLRYIEFTEDLIKQDTIVTSDYLLLVFRQDWKIEHF